MDSVPSTPGLKATITLYILPMILAL